MPKGVPGSGKLAGKNAFYKLAERTRKDLIRKHGSVDKAIAAVAAAAAAKRKAGKKKAA